MTGSTQIVTRQPSAQGQLVHETHARQFLLRSAASFLVLLAVLSLAGCYGAPLGTREESTLLGGASGVGAGALLGSAYGAPGTGAALGGVAGAGLGYLIGNGLQNQQYGRDWRGGQGWREGRWYRGRWDGHERRDQGWREGRWHRGRWWRGRDDD